MLKQNRIYFAILIVIGLILPFTSCEDYLDKSPEAGLTSDEIFNSFDKYQGFVEDTYWCMVDPMYTGGVCIFNFGDDLYQPREDNLGSLTSDYRKWEWSAITYFYANGTVQYYSNPFATVSAYQSAAGRSNLGYWHGGWLGIRKANIALANLDKLAIPYKDAPLEEQRNLLEGQALMLRALFHFDIIKIWGGMPYIDRVLDPSEKLRFPRLNYAETTDLIEKDMLRAAELLPVDWDETATGKITLGTNSGRLTKGAAYALLGKAMLYAASPLMNGESEGTGGYTSYNKEYAKKAVKYLGEVIKLSKLGGGTTYDLLPWENYSDNFYMFNNGKIPGAGKEGVLYTPLMSHSRSTHIGDMLTSMGGWGLGCGPTENYVQYFGMANGENFDPSVYSTPSINPWEHRDPRFYYNIITDGSTLWINGTTKEPAKFYIGGRDRSGWGKSDTGYGWKKFRDLRLYPNGSYGWSSTTNRRLPMIRLADVYLLYAEAANEAYGYNVSPASADPGVQTCNVKAWEAVKAVRDRVKNDDGSSLALPAHMYASDAALRETIRRERAVELAFEGQRWYDLRRWYVSDLPEYMRVDQLEFDQNHTYYTVKPIGTKVFQKKHFWMPLRDSQTQIYSEFFQNPGW